MSAVGRIVKLGKRKVFTSGEDFYKFGARYLSHHNNADNLRHAANYYRKEELQAIGNQLHKAKKRIDSDVRTGKSSGMSKRPVQTSEAVGKAPEPSGAQAVKEVPEPKATGGSVRSQKSGPRTKTTEQPGDSTQTTSTGTEIPNAGTKTPDEKQAAQPGGGEPPVAEKEAGTQSGGGYNPYEYAGKAAKDQNLSSSERQMYGRLGNMRANAQKVFDKGTDEQIKNELGLWGIETREGAKAADYMNDIDEVLRKKAESGPTIGDKFRAHHGVGLTGLGVVGVSTLDLASSRGQQSNAQLYSDPFA